MIQRIDKSSLAERVYQTLKTDLLSQYREGEVIPSENALAKRLDVSRTVLRQALSRLRQEHVIITKRGKGSFLANPQSFIGYECPGAGLDISALEQITELRCLIECRAVLEAVKVAKREELERLLDAASEIERSADDRAAFNIADYRFHLEIVRCSHNAVLLKVMQSLRDEILACLDAMNSVNDSRGWGIELHKKIAECIIERRGREAVSLLKNNGEYNLAKRKPLIFKGEQNKN